MVEYAYYFKYFADRGYDDISHVLRLPYTFRSTIFPEIGFLHPSNSPSVIFHLKKKVLKKSEYRRRNEHISFLTGSKNSSLE